MDMHNYWLESDEMYPDYELFDNPRDLRIPVLLPTHVAEDYLKARVKFYEAREVLRYALDAFNGHER